MLYCRLGPSAPWVSLPGPTGVPSGTQAGWYRGHSANPLAAAADCCKMNWLRVRACDHHYTCCHKHTLSVECTCSGFRPTWVALCRTAHLRSVLSSFCTTLTTFGKLFDTTSTGKIPGCPHSIRHISLVVKVSKLIHFQTAGNIL